MTRQEILDQISQTLGGVPGWLDGVPDPFGGLGTLPDREGRR